MRSGRGLKPKHRLDPQVGQKPRQARALESYRSRLRRPSNLVAGESRERSHHGAYRPATHFAVTVGDSTRRTLGFEAGRAAKAAAGDGHWQLNCTRELNLASAGQVRQPTAAKVPHIRRPESSELISPGPASWAGVFFGTRAFLSRSRARSMASGFSSLRVSDRVRTSHTSGSRPVGSLEHGAPRARRARKPLG